MEFNWTFRNRTHDRYDGLVAFAILPLVWIHSEKSKPIRLPKFSQNFAPVLIALVSVFAFTATSQSRENYHNEEFSEIYKIEKTPVDLLKKLQDYEAEYFSESKDRRQNLITVGLRLKENVCDDLPYASFEIAKDGAGSRINLKNISYGCGEKISGNSNPLNSPERKKTARKQKHIERNL